MASLMAASSIMEMPPSPFPVLDVSSWKIASEEVAGGEETVWLAEPGSDKLWLYKPVTEHEGQGDQGEDWAEKVVAEIGLELGVPCATVALCQRDGRNAALSLDLTPAGWELHHGSVLMPSVVADYRQGILKPKGRPGHSLLNIRKALHEVQAPPGADMPRGAGAFDVFAGYLMMDALVANRDRHDDNWAVLRPRIWHASSALAGSYDHAGSLGYNLQEHARAARILEGTVEDWARKGTAWRFEHVGKPRSLVDLAAEGLHMVSRATRSHWLDHLQALDVTYVTELLAGVPRLSDSTVSFGGELVRVNRRRLLDAC